MVLWHWTGRKECCHASANLATAGRQLIFIPPRTCWIYGLNDFKCDAAQGKYLFRKIWKWIDFLMEYNENGMTKERREREQSVQCYKYALLQLLTKMDGVELNHYTFLVQIDFIVISAELVRVSCCYKILPQTFHLRFETFFFFSFCQSIFVSLEHTHYTKNEATNIYFRRQIC